MNLLKEKLIDLKNRFGKRAATLTLACAMGAGAAIGLTGCDGVTIGNLSIGGEKYTMPDGTTYRYQDLLDNLEDIKALNEQANEANNGEGATLSTEQFEKLIALYNKDIVDNHQEEVFKAIQDAFGIDASTLNDDELVKISRPYDFFSEYSECLEFVERSLVRRYYLNYKSHEEEVIGGGYCGSYWTFLIPIRIEKNSDGDEWVYYKRCEDFDVQREYSLLDIEYVYDKNDNIIGRYMYETIRYGYYDINEFKKAMEESEVNYTCGHIKEYVADIDENVKDFPPRQ